MTTVDAHAHLWDRRRFTYAWLDDQPALPTTYLAEDLSADAAGIDEFIFVQADCDPSEGFEEASWAQATMGGTSRLAGIVAFAPLEEPGAGDALSALDTIDAVVGVRRLLQDEDRSFFEFAGLSEGLAQVVRRGWTFDACVRWHQLDWLATLARQHEDLTVVVDHLGKPPIKGSHREFKAWRRALALVAELPNTVVKLSGLPAESTGGLPAEAFTPWLSEAIELFGTDRAMIGTDWPVSRSAAMTRGDWFQIVRECTGVAGLDWELIAGLTSRQAYDLGTPSSPAQGG